MSDLPAKPDAVSDETLKAMLLDGLVNHPVSSDELLERICNGSIPEKSGDFPISDDFPAMVLRYLLKSDSANQLRFIIEIFRRDFTEKKPGKISRKAFLALAILADEQWYQPALDAWTNNDRKVRGNIERAFGFPQRMAAESFNGALAARLEKSEVKKFRQKMLDDPAKYPGSLGFLSSSEMFDTFLAVAFSDKANLKRAGIISLANYSDPIVEELAIEMVCSPPSTLKRSVRIQALCTLLLLNPEKGIHYFWGEMKREEDATDGELTVTVMAMILSRIDKKTRYSWICTTFYSPRRVVRGVAILCINLELEERWIEPLIDLYSRENECDIKEVILSILQRFKDFRIGEFLATQIHEGFSSELFDFLYEKYPQHLTKEIIRIALQYGGWKSQENAIKAINQFYDPLWIPELRTFCMDGDDDVRCAAILELAKYDDGCVFHELVFALLDTDEKVRDRAKEILTSESGFPAVEAMKDKGIDPYQAACRLKMSAENVFKWGQNFGKTVLGCNVEISRLMDGLGRTFMNSYACDVARIEVTFDPIVYQHKFGCEIIEALILHEIGHHLYDNLQTRGLKSVMGQVKTEGLDKLFSILQDERLERRLRSNWPAYQLHIDRLNSYAFAEQTTDIPLSAYAEALGLDSGELEQKIKSGQKSGVLSLFDEEKGGQQVTLKPVDLMALPGVMAPLQAFLFCLIGGFNPRLYHDARLSKAMAMIPPNFKDLNHAGMLQVARSIRHLLDIPESNESSRKRREKGDERGGNNASLSTQTAQALAEAIRQLLDCLKSLHTRMQTVSSDLKVPLDLLEAAARGEFPSLINDGTGESNTQQLAKAQESRKSPGGKGLNLSKDADFNEIRVETMHEFDSKGHAELVVPIRPHIRALRAYFEQLGMQVTEESGVRQGRRLDTGRARLLPATGNPNIMIRRYDAEMADAYLGIVIDKSGSMDGEEMERAKSFATLICESARGIRGISGDVGAFDDDTYYHLGTLQHCAISSLEAGGGNNDAGGLARAAERALAGGRKNKLLIMISDGSPTECSVEALAELVQHLQRDYGIVCVQVAVDSIEHEAFPDFVDLTTFEFHEAVSRFGQMIRQHTRHWR